jgi:hypothetical protein
MVNLSALVPWWQKKTGFFMIFLLSPFLTNIYAQKETFDVISYSPPGGWKKEVRDNLITYTGINNTTKTWCRIGVVRSTASKGNIVADFESEWKELIIKNYNPTDAPKINEVRESDGWKIKEGVTKFKFNNADAIAMLTTISGFDRCASIVITMSSQDYLKDIDMFLTSVEYKKMSSAKQPAAAENIKDNASVMGIWKATASDQSSFRVNNGVMNYIIRQYTFNNNGTYSFTSKAFDPLMDQILLGKESGKYQISGDNLTIIPENSVIEAWSKKDGKDEWGKIINSQIQTPEKLTYRFNKHFFEGIRKWSLVLQADNATRRDGPFSGNKAFANSWIYDTVLSGGEIVLP